MNYDIIQSDKVKFDKEEKEKLLKVSLDIIQDPLYDEMMTNISKVEDPDLYYNWYRGYTDIMPPYYTEDTNQLYYHVSSSATSGNISTKYFGDTFDANKVDGNIRIVISVNVPHSVIGDNDTTLMFNVKKVTMQKYSSNDQMHFVFCSLVGFGCPTTNIAADLAQWDKNISVETYLYNLVLDRKVLFEDIKNMKVDKMPGFSVSWHYNKELEAEAMFINSDKTKEFVR